MREHIMATISIPTWLVFSMAVAGRMGAGNGFAEFVPGFNPDTKATKRAQAKDEAAMPAFEEAKAARNAIIAEAKGENLSRTEMRAVYNANPAPEYPDAVAIIAAKLLVKAGATEESCRAARDYFNSSNTQRAASPEGRRIVATAIMLGTDMKEANTESRAADKAHKAAKAKRVKANRSAKAQQGGKARKGAAAASIVLTLAALQDMLDEAARRAVEQAQG